MKDVTEMIGNKRPSGDRSYLQTGTRLECFYFIGHGTSKHGWKPSFS